MRSVDESDELSQNIDALDLNNVDIIETSLTQIIKKESTKIPDAVVASKAAVKDIVPSMIPAVIERQAASKHEDKTTKIQDKEINITRPSLPKQFSEHPPTAEPKSNSSIVSCLRLQEFRKTPQQPMKAQEATRIVFNDLQARPLPPTPFKATLLAGDPDTKLFSICQQESCDYLSKIEAFIAEYLANAVKTPYTPEKGEMVLAKFQGTFYRGTCKEKTTDGYLINYIDYGNSDIVKKEDMLAFNKKLMLDVVVHSVLLENFPDVIDEKIAAFLDKDGVSLKNARKLKDGYVAIIADL